jgi:hypothetical protein
MARRVTTSDLQALGLDHLDPAEIGVMIDPGDLRAPSWRGVSVGAGAEHRRQLAAKYRPEDLPDIDHVVIAAILSLHEHPVLARRRQEMLLRL